MSGLLWERGRSLSWNFRPADAKKSVCISMLFEPDAGNTDAGTGS